MNRPNSIQNSLNLNWMKSSSNPVPPPPVPMVHNLVNQLFTCGVKPMMASVSPNFVPKHLKRDHSLTSLVGPSGKKDNCEASEYTDFF